MVVAAQDLLEGGFPAGFVVDDAVAHHIDAHVRGGLVGTLPVDALKDGVEHREDLHIPVVVYRGFAVGLQMEGVDHIHIIEIRGGGFIGQVDRVLQGQIPDGKRLKLGVAGLDAPAVLMVELGETGGHLAAAGSRSGDNHKRP